MGYTLQIGQSKTICIELKTKALLLISSDRFLPNWFPNLLQFHIPLAGFMDSFLPETAIALIRSSSWWHDVDNSATWQDRIYYSLSVLYGLVAAVALVSLKILMKEFSQSSIPCSEKEVLIELLWFQIQLIRIERRVPEFGWTTQKVFFLLNFLVSAGMY